MSGKLGFTSQKQTQTSESRPYFTSTRYSSYADNKLKLDPTIRTLQEEALGRSRGLMGNLSQGTSDYLTRSMDIRNRLMGGESQFRQARVNPIIQAGAERRGQLQENIGARQIAGSSFADQALSNLDFDTARQIGDASALADAESLQAVTGLDKDMLNAIIGRVQVEANINGWTTDVAQQRLQQELSSFGLGTSQTGKAKTTGFSLEGTFGGKAPGGKTG